MRLLKRRCWRLASIVQYRPQPNLVAPCFTHGGFVMKVSLHLKARACAVWVCAASLVASCALSAPAQKTHSNSISVVASTVPADGDINPYGIARVPRNSGSLVKGNILISNFNNSTNLQGTGTTIVQIAPDGSSSLFAQIDPSTLPGPCPGGLGLTTALAVLSKGWVIVGSLPTTDGTAATAQAGCLLVLDHN